MGGGGAAAGGAAAAGGGPELVGAAYSGVQRPRLLSKYVLLKESATRFCFYIKPKRAEYSVNKASDRIVCSHVPRNVSLILQTSRLLDENDIDNAVFFYESMIDTTARGHAILQRTLKTSANISIIFCGHFLEICLNKAN